MLEARDRVGGRVESALNELGERIDTGGQFLCEDMPELMALAPAHGKTLVETPIERRLHRAARPVASRGASGSTQATMAIRERMNAIEPDDPAIAGLTVAAWLDRPERRRRGEGRLPLDDRRPVVPGRSNACRSGT